MPSRRTGTRARPRAALALLLTALLGLPILPGASGSAVELPVPPPASPPAPGTCQARTCAWEAAPAPVLDGWVPGVGEIEPATWSAEGLVLRVDRAARAGSFYFSLADPLPVSGNATFSVWARSEGGLDRFPLLLREEGFGGPPEEGDTVVFVDASPEWRFVSFAWSPIHASSTHVRIALRGELQAGASATIAFALPYFGPDATRWIAGDATEPFALGPRAGFHAAAPGPVTVQAVNASGERRSFTGVATADPPRLDVLLQSSPRLPGGVRAMVVGTSGELLQNGRFERGLSGWALEPWERGAVSRATWDAGAARLDVGAAPEESSVWLAQPVSWTPNRSLDLVWRAHDDRAMRAYALVVLESDGTRHEVKAPPGGSLGAGGVLTFRPTTSSGEVQLRVVFPPGASGAVWFDDVSLRPAASYAWSLDGRRVAQGPVADLAWDRALPHVLNVTDGRTTRSLDVPAGLDLGELPFRVRDGPRAALHKVPLVLDATGDWSDAWDALSTREPWAAWETESAESPGSFRFRPGTSFLVEAGPMPATAAGGIQRLLVLPPNASAMDLVFRYQTTGDVDRVQAVARHHVPGVTEYREVRANFTPSPAGATGTLRIPAAPQNHTLLLVGLRAMVVENKTGAVAFEDASLLPALTYAWGGVRGSGPVATFAGAAPGVHPWNVTIRTPGGLVLRDEGLLGVVPPVTPFPTLGEGVAATWNASHLPPDATLRLEGPASAVAPASAARVASLLFVPGRYEVVAESPGGQRLVLGNATLNDRAGLLGQPPAWTAARGASMVVSLRFASPEIERAVLILEAGGQEARVPLERKADAWTGRWRPDLSWSPGAVAASVELHDARSVVVVPLGEVALAPAAGRAEGSFLVLGLLAVATLVAWAPRELATRRWGPAHAGALRLALDVAGAAAATALAVVLVPRVPVGAGVAIGTLLVASTLAASLAAATLARRFPASSLRDLAEAALVAGAAGAATLVAVTLAHGSVAFSGIPRRVILLATVLLAALLVAARLVRRRP